MANYDYKKINDDDLDKVVGGISVEGAGGSGATGSGGKAAYKEVHKGAVAVKEQQKEIQKDVQKEVAKEVFKELAIKSVDDDKSL